MSVGMAILCVLCMYVIVRYMYHVAVCLGVVLAIVTLGHGDVLNVHWYLSVAFLILLIGR